MTDLLQPTTLRRHESWRAQSLSPNTIVRAFKRMWMEIADERREGNRLSKQMVDGAMVRTQTINLVTLSDTEDDLRRVDRLVRGLSEFVPSRIIMLLDSHGWDDDLEISAEVEEHPRTPPLSPSRLEMVMVKARPEQLASVALPVLVPELPVYVWCASGKFVDNELVADLARYGDRVVVDSSLVDRPGVALRYLAELCGQSRTDVRLGDFAWTRLTAWRQMVAQFFDTDDAIRSLHGIDEVVVEYGDAPSGGRSATTSALLLAGWLATRLGWRTPGEEMVRSKDGWRLTFRAGERGRSREVVLVLRPVWSDADSPSLLSVQMTSGGLEPASFSIHRTSPETIVTVGELPDAAPVERTIFAPIDDDPRLLTAELRMSGYDQVYVEALAFAARLWPEEETTAR